MIIDSLNDTPNQPEAYANIGHAGFKLRIQLIPATIIDGKWTKLDCGEHSLEMFVSDFDLNLHNELSEEYEVVQKTLRMTGIVHNQTNPTLYKTEKPGDKHEN